MKLAGLIDGMARALQVPPSRLRTAAAQLRKHKLISTGPRGPGAPEMTPRDAANLLLAVMYDGELAEAHETVQRLRMARLVRFQDKPWDRSERLAELPPHHFLYSEEGQIYELGDLIESMLEWWVRYGTLGEGQEDGDDLYPMNLDLEVACPGYRVRFTFSDPCCTPWRFEYEWKSPEQEKYEAESGRFSTRWDARNGPHIWSSRTAGEDCLYLIAECLRGREWEDDWDEFTPSYDSTHGELAA